MVKFVLFIVVCICYTSAFIFKTKYDNNLNVFEHSIKHRVPQNVTRYMDLIILMILLGSFAGGIFIGKVM